MIYYRIINKIKRIFKIKEINQKLIYNFYNEHKKNIISIENCSRNTLAIIIPCYKHQQYLSKCLDSILNQTRFPDEIIIVNDDPKGAITDIINDFENKISGKKIKLRFILNRKNIGQAASINKGLHIAESDLIMIMNDDDYLMHDTVEYMFYNFNKYNEIALFGGTCIPFTSDEDLSNNNIIGNFKEEKIVIKIPEDVRHYRRFNDLNMTHTGCTFLKKAALSIHGYSSKKMRVVPFSDRDFQLRINTFYSVACSNNVPVSFWRSNSSVDKGKNS